MAAASTSPWTLQNNFCPSDIVKVDDGIRDSVFDFSKCTDARNRVSIEVVASPDVGIKEAISQPTFSRNVLTFCLITFKYHTEFGILCHTSPNLNLFKSVCKQYPYCFWQYSVHLCIVLFTCLLH